MKTRRILFIVGLFGFLISGLSSAQPLHAYQSSAFTSQQSSFWSTVYYPEFGDVSPTPAQVDWTAFTHVIIFACGMNASASPYFREMPGTADSANFDGGYNKKLNWVKAIVDSSHRHGVKVLMCIAGLGGSTTVTGPGSTGDMETVVNTPSMRHTFVNYVAGVNGFARRRNLDGLDFDFEYPSSNDTGFKSFITELRDTLNHWPVPGMITTVVSIWKTPVYASDTAWANTSFDQINLMCYGMADGSSITGFNSPIVPDPTNYPGYNGTSWFNNGNGHGPYDGWAKYGIRKSKIGCVLPFEMRYVAGNDAPGQTRVGTSSYANYSQVVAAKAANPGSDHFDAISKVPWVGYDDASGKHFYSYENQASIQAKVDTVRNGGYGGVGIWELFRGYAANANPPDELLQYFKKAVGGTTVTVDTTRPAVSITSPITGATVTGIVPVTVAASDNIGVARVDFLCNGTVLASSSTPPFTWQWSIGALTGNLTLLAKAYDAAGNVGTSAAVVVSVAAAPPDTVRPTVSVTSPANGATISGTISVSATATDNVGVTRVDFLINGSVAGTSSSSPYTYSWNTSGLSGSQTISAKAYDAAGNVGVSPSVSVTVPVSIPPDSGSLTVYNDAVQTPWINSSWSATNNFASTDYARSGSYSIQTVQNGWGALRFHSGQWSSTVNIDPNRYAVVSFAVYAPSAGLNLQVSVGGDTNTAFRGIIYNSVPANQWVLISLPMSQLDSARIPISYVTIQNWSSGTVTYYVDDIQFGGTTSQPDTSHPTVSIINPANNSTVSGTFQVTALASDGRKLVGVQFACDGVNVGQKLTAVPYSYSINSMQYANGIHTISATAQDSVGLTGTSSVRVMISNSSPTLVGGVSVRDNFDYSVSNVSLAGRFHWVNLTSQSGKATLQIVNNAVQPYNRKGYGNCGGVAWDSLLGAGTQVGVVVRQKGGNGSTLSFCINVRMNNEDLSAGNGYRLRYLDNPYGTDQLSLQRVTGSKGTVTLSSVNQEIHAGDTLSVQVLNDSTHTIVAFINRTPVLATRDTVYNPSSWYVWLYGGVFSTPVRIDNFMCGSLAVSANIIPSALLQDHGSPLSGGGNEIPTRYSLFQNYPNPFNPSTNIGYELPVAADVSLIVYNILGSEVARLAVGEQSAGIHAVVWNAGDKASGLYFVRLQVRGRDGNALFQQTMRMLLTK